MRAPLRAIWSVLILGCIASATEIPDLTPHLLLTPQRLKRLRRDRERQTARWTNFETRVQSAPDSSERGFELALYYQVTQDTASGRGAIDWALKHIGDLRQIALVADWCSAILTPADRKYLTPSAALLKAPSASFAALRDRFFAAVVFGPTLDETDAANPSWSSLLQKLQAQGPASLSDDDLYAAAEYLDAVHTALKTDLRRSAPAFFSQFPAELLLSLKPQKVQSPGWKLHAAALAIVSLDPNLENAQFLQGWGLEENQAIGDGPGTAYEFLWADPYLPGVSYQNLEPWAYDSAGRLFARSDWSPAACWIALSSHPPEHVNCPPGWDTETTHFGHLTLIARTTRCVVVPRHAPSDTIVLWRLQPGETLYHPQLKQKIPIQADAAGLLRLSTEIVGRVCAAEH